VPRRLPFAVAISALSALLILVAIVFLAPGPANFLFVAAGAAVLATALGRRATGDDRR
jgi:threonine/homoserine/homoserine lactone efflux protein